MTFNEYLTNEALILIPALYIIGMFLKNTQKINDKYIPIILLICGIAGTVGILGFSVHSVIQGVLVTGTSVYTNQLLKQCKKD